MSKIFYESGYYVDEETGEVWQEDQYAMYDGKIVDKETGEIVYDEHYEEEISQKDKEDRDRLSFDQDFIDTFNEGNAVYQKITQMIDMAEAENPKAAALLRDMLERNIADKGLTDVAMAMAGEEDELIAEAETALKYNAGAPTGMNAINAIDKLINNKVMSMEEARGLQDAIDEDDYEGDL